MRVQTLLSLLLFVVALGGCANGESAPSGVESVAGQMSGLKNGPAGGHGDVPKTDSKDKTKPDGT